jgi:uroporphyrinogen III methyltransferase/synthase
VAELSLALTWFETRPLFGQTIVVTRPIDQAGVLMDRFAELGAEVLLQPAIEISDPPDFDELDESINQLNRFDWVVFSSANGVHRFMDRLLSRSGDLRCFSRGRLACIGPGTAEALDSYHLRADLLPGQYRAESLAEALVGEAAGKRFLLVRASRGREVLAQQITAAGGEVQQVIAYTSGDTKQVDEAIRTRLGHGEIDWMTVTSSAIARSLVQLFGEDLGRTRLVAISPLTSGVLREHGFEPTAEAATYTMDGVVRAVLDTTCVEP